MTSPTAPGGFGLDELDSALDSITDDETAASTDPTPAVPGAPPPASADPETPETPPELGEPEADDSADASATDPVAPATPETPTPDISAPAGTPFAFRVDGREVTPEGAVQLPDGSILFPAKAWQQVQGSFLGDRGVWRQKEARYQQAVSQAEASAKAQIADQMGAVELERDQARAALEEFQRILAAGPDAVQQWAENFAVNRPALEARMQARALEVQLEAERRQVKQFQAQRDQQTEEQRAEELRPQLEAHFDKALDHYLSGPFAGVAATPQEKAELRSFLWETHRAQLFYEDEQGIGFRKEILEAVLGREKARVEAVAKQTATLGAAATRNAAAIAPTPVRAKPKAAVVPPKKKAVDPDEVLDADIDEWLVGNN